MRIQSITEANTNQQFNPQTIHNDEYKLTWKSASLTSFKDYLKSQIQDDGGSARVGNNEYQAASAVWGLCMLQLPIRPELKLRARAYDSMSD